MTASPAERAHAAALRLNELVRDQLGTQPLMADFYPGTQPMPGNWNDLAAELARIRDELGTPESMDDRLLHGMVTSYELQARVGAGEQVNWTDQVRGYVQIDPQAIADSRIKELRQDLERALDRAGYTGDLKEACTRWNEDKRVPRERFADVAHEYLRQARRLAEQRLGALPEGTHIELRVVHDVFYNGYNQYTGRFQGECRLNGDFHWTYPQLRHTVAHEAFSGHHAISAIREDLATKDRLPRGAALYYARTPLTPIIEGTCEIANEFLEWEWDENDAVYACLNRYRKAVMTNVAIDVNRDGMAREEAILKLGNQAFADKNWADARYVFLTHPLWRTSFPHYWFGTEIVRAAQTKLLSAGLIERLPDLTHRYPHTVETFQLAVTDLLRQRLADAP